MSSQYFRLDILINVFGFLEFYEIYNVCLLSKSIAVLFEHRYPNLMNELITSFSRGFNFVDLQINGQKSVINLLYDIASQTNNKSEFTSYVITRGDLDLVKQFEEYLYNDDDGVYFCVGSIDVIDYMIGKYNYTKLNFRRVIKTRFRYIYHEVAKHLINNIFNEDDIKRDFNFLTMFLIKNNTDLLRQFVRDSDCIYSNYLNKNIFRFFTNSKNGALLKLVGRIKFQQYIVGLCSNSRTRKTIVNFLFDNTRNKCSIMEKYIEYCCNVIPDNFTSSIYNRDTRVKVKCVGNVVKINEYYSYDNVSMHYTYNK